MLRWDQRQNVRLRDIELETCLKFVSELFDQNVDHFLDKLIVRERERASIDRQIVTFAHLAQRRREKGT